MCLCCQLACVVCKAPLSTWWRDERAAVQPSAALALAAGCCAAQAGQPTSSQAQKSCTQALTCSCSTELLFSVVGSCHLRLRCAMLRNESRSKGCSPEASAKRAGTCLGQGGRAGRGRSVDNVSRWIDQAEVRIASGSTRLDFLCT